MRITSQMIQNNSLYNINKQKAELNKAQNQVMTGKKISRPSEDPASAVRSLKFSADISKIDQYLNKNVVDARQWLDTTETSLNKAGDILTNLIKDANQGSNTYLTTDEYETILTDMEVLAKEFYQTGNDDCGGRYVFSGYRTSTPLTFLEDCNEKYTIKEKDLKVNEFNYVTDKGVEKLYKIKLSYDNIENLSLENENGKINIKELSYKEALKYVSENKGYAYVKETGEIICSSLDNANLKASYEKNEWKNGDIRPEHYFECESGGIEYKDKKQSITYDVGFNSKIEININAKNVFSFEIGNIVKELKNKLGELKELENNENSKEYGYAKDTFDNLMKSSIEKFQKQLENVNISLTKVGTTGNKLDLIETRLKEQFVNLQKLKSDNDDIDLTEAAINLTNVKNIYEASLLTTSKTAEISLLKYI